MHVIDMDGSNSVLDVTSGQEQQSRTGQEATDSGTGTVDDVHVAEPRVQAASPSLYSIMLNRAEELRVMLSAALQRLIDYWWKLVTPVAATGGLSTTKTTVHTVRTATTILVADRAIGPTAAPVPAITVLLRTPTALMNDNSTTASEIALRRRPYRPDTDTYTTYVQLILSAPWLLATTSSSTVAMALTLMEPTPVPEDLVFHGDSSSPWHPLGQPLPVDDLLVALPSRRLSATAYAAWHAGFAADPWLQARWAAKRMKQAAEHRAIAPRPRDPVTHDCSCGWCPDGTAAYELCAAVTIRRTMRSFGPRASSSGSAGASVARRVSQRSCAALAFAPPRFGRARG